jgi:uncharacterized protein YbaR (Trm112 family)
MHKFLIKMLECPRCHGELAWDIIQALGDRVEFAQINCHICSSEYEVKHGVGQFLTPDFPGEDLWEQVDSQLIQYLRQNPQIEKTLMEVPLDTLSPADQFFRGLVLEENGEYGQAKITLDMANKGIYTAYYLACSENMINIAIDRLKNNHEPVVDLASGKGMLVERMAQDLTRYIVGTDKSPRVLLGNRRRFEYFDLYDKVSFLAFDARRTPFKNGAVNTLTTYQGLPNIREPGYLLQELRRIVSGSFLGITLFFQEDNQENNRMIEKIGLSNLIYRRSAFESFARAGWEVETIKSCIGKALPTPVGVVIEGAGIDAIPVAETKIEWDLLLAV